MSERLFLPYIKSRLPEVESKDFVLERYHLPLGKIRNPVWTSNFPGEYVRFRDADTHQIWMTDEYCDWFTGVKPVLEAASLFPGNALISGLGIGMLVECLAVQGLVQEVTILESNLGVIDAVFRRLNLAGMEAEVIQCDAKDFSDFGSYDIVWHDIWIDSIKSLRDAKIMSEKYQASWTWSWPEEMNRLGV